jgi:hypothetical protein
MRRLIYATLLLALVALPAAAQQQYGTVAGTVVDGQQQALPGVTVTLAGPAMQGARTAVTDEAGRYRFVPVPAGEQYALKFELAGFNELDRGGVIVNVGRETKVNAEMALSSFAETITVTAEKLVVDTSKSTVDTTVEWGVMDNLSTSRHYNTIWYMTPGVPMAGNTGQGQNNPSVHGAGGDDNAVLIDGVDTTDPRLGTWGTQINWDTIQEAQIQTAGYLAEFGRATGGVMNLVTKSGGNQFAFTLRGVMRDSEWGKDPGFDEERGIDKAGSVQETEFRPNFTLGGPILTDKLWFFVGYEQRDRDRTYAVYNTYEDLVAGTLTEVISSYTGHQASAKLTWQATPNHSVIAYYNEDPIDISNRRAITSQFYSPSTQVSQFQGGHNGSLQWYGALSPSFFIEAKYQQTRQQLSQAPQQGGFNEVPHFIDRNTGFRTGAAWTSYDSYGDRDGLLLTGSYFLDSDAGSHQIKGGIEYMKIFPEAGTFYNEAGYYRTRGTAPNSRYLYLDQDPMLGSTDKYYALFLQDQWRWGNLALNIGVRAEQFSGTANTGDEVIKFDLADQIAPRIGFAYDLNGNSIHGSVGRFYDLPNNYISRYMGESPGHQQYWLWNGSCAATGNWWETPDSCWTLQYDNPLFGGGYEVDPNIKPIYVDEFTIGYDQLLSDSLAIGATYVWREQKSTIEPVDPDYDGVYVWTNSPLPTVTVEDGRVFTTNSGFKKYQGIELSLKKRLGPKGIQFMASYTYNLKSEGWQGTGGTEASTSYSQWSGFYGADPDYMDPRWYGDIESPHNVKFFGSWTAPWRMIVGLTAYWNSGFLYTPQTPGDYNFLPLERQGSAEVGDNWETDIHLEQPVRIGPIDIALYLEALNVFNNQQPINRGNNDADPASYGLPTQWQTPTQYVVGFKLEY